MSRGRYLRAPVAGLAAVELVLARDVTAQGRPHVHSGYCVGLMDQGQRVITLGRASWLVGPGEMFVLHPGQRHQCHSPGPHSYRVLRLPPQLVAEVAASETLPDFAAPRLDAPDLARQFRRLPGQLLGRSAARARGDALRAFVWEWLRHAAPGQQGVQGAEEVDPRVAKAASFLRIHHAEPLRLEVVAAVAGLSACHFQRVFLQATGLSPLEFQQRERVRAACSLLEAGASLAHAAQAVGCCDQSHLCRLFHACLGFPPTVWAGR